MPLVWASRLMGASLQERVSGADLVPEAGRTRRHPRLQHLSCWVHAKPPRVAQLDGLANTIQRSGLWAAIAPRFAELRGDGPRRHPAPDRSRTAGYSARRLWQSQAGKVAGDASPSPSRSGLHRSWRFARSCSPDALPRAPLWMRDHGLEWLFRTWHEPARLGWRYARDASGLARYLTAQLGRNCSPAQTAFAQFN